MAGDVVALPAKLTLKEFSGAIAAVHPGKSFWVGAVEGDFLVVFGVGFPPIEVQMTTAGLGEALAELARRWAVTIN